MKRDRKLIRSASRGRVDVPQRAPLGWFGRQAHLIAIAWRVARLRVLADRINKLATTAARRYELVAVEANGFDMVVASLRVRAINLEVHKRAGLLAGTVTCASGSDQDNCQ